jgi:hypothetical protein
MAESFAVVMRTIFYTQAIAHKDLVALRHKIIMEAYKHKLDNAVVAMDVLLMLREGYSVDSILNHDFMYEVQA